MPRASLVEKILLIFILVLLTGCQSALMSKLPVSDIQEQQYINAELGFSVKHPLEWRRQIVPVSSPQYRPDIVVWNIENRQTGETSGVMVVESYPASRISINDRLNDFLAENRDIETLESGPYPYDGGQALKHLGRDGEKTFLTVFITGRARDFMMSIQCINSDFEKSRPLFEDVIDSLAEIIPSSYTEFKVRS